MRVFVRNSMTHTWSVVSSTPAIGMGGAGTKKRTLIEIAQTSLERAQHDRGKFKEFESPGYLLKNCDTILCD